jgi:tRNA(Ile2) C34 agmatinyltransferase TiaS
MSESKKQNPVRLGETPVCPDCGAATQSGDFSVGQSVSSLVIDGPAWPDLFFTARRDSKWTRKSMGLDKRSGWLCSKCGFILIRGAVAAKVEEDLRDRISVTADRQMLPSYELSTKEA